MIITTPRILERIGQLKNSRSGILATLHIPPPLSLEAFSAKKMLIFDGIDDTGELGTLLRSACAFDWDAVWITHSCADPFDPICLRASQGVLLSMPYRVGSIENALQHARREKSMLKLRFVESKSGGLKIGLADPELGESSMSSSGGEVCLLIQKEFLDSPKANDFKSIEISGISPSRTLPLSVIGSSLIYAISNRYFPGKLS